MIHSVISTVLAFYVLIYGCEDTNVSAFFDNKCFEKPRDIHYKVCLVSAGYLIYDFIIYFFVVKAVGEVAVQTYIHHIMASSGFLMTLYNRDISATYGCMSLGIEGSSLFLNIRYFMYEFGFNEHPMFMVN